MSGSWLDLKILVGHYFSKLSRWNYWTSSLIRKNILSFQKAISQCYFVPRRYEKLKSNYKICSFHENWYIVRLGGGYFKKGRGITYFHASVVFLWVFGVCVCVCVYVCVLFIYTISISIICASQNKPSLTYSI